MKRVLFLSCILIILLLKTAYADVSVEKNENIVKAKVSEVVNATENGQQKQEIKAIVMEGKYKDQEITIHRSIDKYSSNDFMVLKGSKIYAQLATDEHGNLTASLMRVAREKSILILMICFFAALLLFGMSKGIASAICLAFSGFMIIEVFIPAVIKGKDPISYSIFTSVAIAIVSFTLISGFTKKSLAAMLSSIAGTIAAGLIALYFGQISCLSGMADEHSQFLITELGVTINFKGLLFSGIILGSMGAVMDVSMSIVSVVYELKLQNSRATYWELLVSGLRVGRDIMATMVNTLILAYAGASIPLFVLYGFMKIPANEIIGSENMSTEIIRSICGSIGLILTVPFTSFIAATFAAGDRTLKKHTSRTRNTGRNLNKSAV